ncbi:hypothetical protein LCGC14_1060730 [marine sediment metagenome]|uniref:ATP-dependent Clp protease proteolytic subunit n=1 Tax=marine sediment metagenome TaxID=412755 RepID=A0A0F9ML92_9ZZZZ
MKKLLIMSTILLFLFIGCVKNVQPYRASIKDGVGFFTFEGTLTSMYFPGALEYFSTRNIKKVVMEIHSPGGNIYEMWRIISWIEKYDNIRFETRVYGIAASAGFVIFLAGDERLVSRHAIFMWHNLASFTAGARLLNKANNGYIASRTILTIEQVLEKITNDDKDWYFGAKEAIFLGIAHGYID